MGRSLLLLCAGALVVASLAMGSVRRNVTEQDHRLSAHEADVIARENAVSAMNQAAPFVLAHFDALTTGAEVSNEALIGAVGEGEGTVSALLSGFAHRLTSTTNTLRLVGGGAAQTLMPTRELTEGSTQQASVRLLGDGSVEVVSEGAFFNRGNGGGLRPVTHRIRRLYARASALDAALVVVAPSVNATLDGAYTIDGRDTDPATLRGTSHADLDRNGIKTNVALVAERFGAVVGSANRGRVMGMNGLGDIAYGALSSPLDDLFDEAYTYAGPARQALASDVLGSTAFGSEASPAVVVRNGDLRVQGTVRGVGVLVVNGDLTTEGSGRLVWEGVVMVRKDGASNASVSLSQTSKVVGSLVVLQGASSFTMPFNGRLGVRYLSSSAMMASSVHVEHAHNGTTTRAQLAPPGANRRGDKLVDYAANLTAGQQVSLLIGARFPSWGTYARQSGQVAYFHAGRGNVSSATGQAYGQTVQTSPYTWRVGFEDKDTQMDIGFGYPEFDYNDQVVEVTLQCRRYSGGSVVTRKGAPVYEACTPTNPDAQPVPPRGLDWSALTASSGVVAGPQAGTQVQFVLNNSFLFYSARAISRLAPLLPSLRNGGPPVLAETWTST